MNPTGARIDNAHHNNLAAKALHETLALEDAVQAALDLTDEQDTLVIVTADHSLVMNIAGTAYRGTDILGTVLMSFSCSFVKRYLAITFLLHLISI